jgi:hypothetical protein
MQKTAAYYVGQVTALHRLGFPEPAVQDFLKSAGLSAEEAEWIQKEAGLLGMAAKGLGSLAGKAVSGIGNLAGKAVSGVGNMARGVANVPGRVANMPTGYMAKTPGAAAPTMGNRVGGFFKGMFGTDTKNVAQGAAGAYNKGRTVGNVGNAGMLGTLALSPFMKS